MLVFVFYIIYSTSLVCDDLQTQCSKYSAASTAFHDAHITMMHVCRDVLAMVHTSVVNGDVRGNHGHGRYVTISDIFVN